MLRGSSTADGSEVNLEAIVHGRETDSLIAGGSELIRFTDAVLSNASDLESARADLVNTLGERAMVDAAGVIGNFQRMVRIADSTGIPVDGFMAEANADVRETLGLNNLPSARLRD
jgi:hypothetical protein